MNDKPYTRDEANDRFLRAERNISFDEIVEALTTHPVDVLDNWSRKHRGQAVYVVEIDGYPWVVPFDETPDAIILRTAFRSRRLKK